MKAFQAKTQRNITIVDLDDETEENATTVSEKETLKDTEKSSEEQVDDNAAEKSTAEADNITTTTTTTAAEEATEAMEVDSEAKKDENETDNAETATEKNKETESTEKSTENIETSAENTEENKQKNDSNQTPLNIPEPSLFELLNWLDNPPEDITFVSEFSITFNDFCEAVKVVQPSAKREGFITVPDVTWDDVGSMHDIREELKLAVLAPVKFPEKLERLGLSAPSGVLLCGPPGCGKTLLAKAIANEAGINFISVKGPELMNMVC